MEENGSVYFFVTSSLHMNTLEHCFDFIWFVCSDFGEIFTVSVGMVEFELYYQETSCRDSDH